MTEESARKAGPDFDTILHHILGCLRSALASAEAAKVCHEHFKSLPDGAGIGPAMEEAFKSWGLAKAQVFREWPPLQLGLLRAVLIEVARKRETGHAVGIRVRGVVGYPPALSVTFTGPDDLEFVFTWPEMV